MNGWHRLCFLIVGLFVASDSFATTFEVTPVQLFLSPTQRAGVLRVTNRSDESVLLQLSLVSWQQRDSKDLYQTSDAIFMTPPLFQLPANKTQVIRFALRRPCSSERQQTYRVHVREINQIRPTKIGQALYFLMDISLPLFVQPRQVIEQFFWAAKRRDSQHLELILHNSGNVTLFVNQWRLVNRSGRFLPASRTKHATFAYILPGQSHHWVIVASAHSKFTDIQATVNGHTNQAHLYVL